jgi:hypothetical protein
LTDADPGSSVSASLVHKAHAAMRQQGRVVIWPFTVIWPCD